MFQHILKFLLVHALELCSWPISNSLYNKNFYICNTTDVTLEDIVEMGDDMYIVNLTYVALLIYKIVFN